MSFGHGMDGYDDDLALKIVPSLLAPTGHPTESDQSEASIRKL